jgi:RimJ/RimL family protein N-acetyltransferase
VSGQPEVLAAHDGFVVRRTVEDDWAEVRALRLEMLADTPLAYLETVEHARTRREQEWRSWARGGSSTDSITAVAITDEGRWVASMTSKIPLGATRPYLLGVYVADGFRGPGGVTDAVLDQIVRWASKRGDVLMLDVHERNERARAAYRKRGWVETGRTTRYPLAAGGLEIEMSRPLR